MCCIVFFLQNITLNIIWLHCITSQCFTLCYTVLHCVTLSSKFLYWNVLTVGFLAFAAAADPWHWPLVRIHRATWILTRVTMLVMISMIAMTMIIMTMNMIMVIIMMKEWNESRDCTNDQRRISNCWWGRRTNKNETNTKTFPLPDFRGKNVNGIPGSLRSRKRQWLPEAWWRKEGGAVKIS